MRALFPFLCGGLCLTLAAERFNLEDAAQIASLSNPQITADGQTVVVGVTRADLKQNRFTTELVRDRHCLAELKGAVVQTGGPTQALAGRQATGVRRDSRRQVPDFRIHSRRKESRRPRISVSALAAFFRRVGGFLPQGCERNPRLQR